MEKPLRNILIGFGIVSIIILVAEYLNTGKLEGFWVNTATEIIGIILTVAFIDYYYRKREGHELLEKLIRELQSNVNVDALKALKELEAKGWLQSDHLHNRFLNDANLSSARIYHASLENCEIWGFDFSNATLSMVNLGNSKINFSDFTGANLSSVDFQNTSFFETKFTGAAFNEVNLQNASFEDIDLDDLLVKTQSLFRSVMPNGKKYNGQYRFPIDIKGMAVARFDLNSDHDWAKYFDVTLEEYQSGQKWAGENLHKYRKDEEN